MIPDQLPGVLRIFKLTIAYDGTAYAGWQRQAGIDTVQARLEAALAEIEGRAVTVHGAGRTDAGVHAWGQVASFKLEHGIDTHVGTEEGPEIGDRGAVPSPGVRVRLGVSAAQGESGRRHQARSNGPAFGNLRHIARRLHTESRQT